MTRDSHPTKVYVSRISNQDKPIETRKIGARLSQKEGDLNSSSNQLLTTTSASLKHQNASSNCMGAQNNNSQTTDGLNTSNSCSSSTKIIHVRITKYPSAKTPQTDSNEDDRKTHKHLKRSSSVGSVSIKRLSKNQLLSKSHSKSKSELAENNTKSYKNVDVRLIRKK